MIKAIPMELSEANAFVDSFHRHHASVHRDKFRVGRCRMEHWLVSYRLVDLYHGI